jgi:dihydrolipoyl dehydrogenase
VIGGGYIGLELGQVYAALGAKVTVVEMLDGLLTAADRDLVNVLMKRLKETFAGIMLNTKVTNIKDTGAALEVCFEGAQAPKGPVTYDKAILAVGRLPNSDGWGRENTRIALDERGFSAVDEQCRSRRLKESQQCSRRAPFRASSSRTPK